MRVPQHLDRRPLGWLMVVLVGGLVCYLAFGRLAIVSRPSNTHRGNSSNPVKRSMARWQDEASRRGDLRDETSAMLKGAAAIYAVTNVRPADAPFNIVRSVRSDDRDPWISFHWLHGETIYHVRVCRLAMARMPDAEWTPVLVDEQPRQTAGVWHFSKQRTYIHWQGVQQHWDPSLNFCRLTLPVNDRHGNRHIVRLDQPRPEREVLLPPTGGSRDVIHWRATVQPRIKLPDGPQPWIGTDGIESFAFRSSEVTTRNVDFNSVERVIRGALLSYQDDHGVLQMLAPRLFLRRY